MANINILITGVSVVTAASIFAVTFLCRSFLYEYNDVDTTSDGPMYTSPWNQNFTKDAMRAKQSELMLSFINESVSPCEDFYEYACGNWERLNEIPKDKWRYSTIESLARNVESELRELLSQPVSGHDGPPSATDKAKMYYKVCMNEKSKRKRGAEPLLKFIKDLGGWPVLDDNWSEDEFDWLLLAINPSSSGMGLIISFTVDQDPSVPEKYTIFLKQTSLGMNNRDNYLMEENSKTLEAYRKLIEEILILLDVRKQKARRVANEIVDFEVLLANATLPPEATKTLPNFQPTLQNVSMAYPYIDWKRYFSGVLQTNISSNQTVVMQLSVVYFKNLYYLLSKTERVNMANYMIWRSVLFFVESLDEKFRKPFYNFISAATGQLEPVPSWKTCVLQADVFLTMPTAALFVRKYFDEYTKNETIKIVTTLKEAFDDNLSELDWFDGQTKAYASKKSRLMRISAGYPDYIRSETHLNRLFENVTIMEGKHFENLVGLYKHRKQRTSDMLFMPYDRDEWSRPTMVNAFYYTGTNRILVLAGLLQPPAFHRYFPQSLNYGAMGMFMGHELIHGFDDSGSKHDVDGNAFQWWSNKSIEQFEFRKNCFLEQYEKYAERENEFKSIATLSENLADNGGLRLSYKAYSKWKQENKESMDDETFPNMKYSEDQLFFLSFAQLFCSAMRPEAKAESHSYEEHSPEKYRVLGALTNFEEFSKAYRCPEGSSMNPKNKCRLW